MRRRLGGMVMRAFGIGCCLAVLASCTSGWPEENVLVFKQSCLAKAKTTSPAAPEAALAAYCNCTAERLQKRYSFEEFTEQEARMAASGQIPAEVQDVVGECRAALGRVAATP